MEFGFKLDDFQLEAVDHINNGKSVVVCAPTGAGKTVIAEHAIQRALKEGKRVFYTTPLKALSNQKLHDFSAKYGENNVGLLTGDTSINRDAQVVVMTTEVFRNMLYGTNLGRVEENLKGVQCVVLDEVHYMNDEQRGTVWEESIIYCPNHIQLIALSATVANSAELTEWINTVHGKTELVYTDFRPVPLKHFYFSENTPDRIVPLFAPGGKLNSRIQPEKNTRKFNTQKTRRRPLVADLVSVLHENDMLPAIYFAFSRKKCDQFVEDCSRLNLLNDFEEKRIVQIIDEYVLDNPYLSKHKQLEYLYCGVASHHAGLLPGWKGLVEKLFQQGLIKVVFATETLAAGINMPARSTVISSISKRTDTGHRILTASEFLQMSGRAGRRGMDKEGFVTVVGTNFQSPEEVAELASSSAEPLGSKFTPGYSMVVNLLQRFSLEQSRELILKSFGYFSSTERLKPLSQEQDNIKRIIEEIENFDCPYKLSGEHLVKYNKVKNQYVQFRKITTTLKKQSKKTGRKDAPEVIEYEQKTRAFEKEMERIKCNYCKKYKKHIKDLEIQQRFVKKYDKISRAIDYEKDIYWKQFMNLVKVLEEFGYIDSNYPTEKGLTAAAIRSENELYFAEVVYSGVLSGLTPSELASVVCAVITEETRGNMFFKFQISPRARKTIAEVRNTLRRVWRVQKDYSVNTPLLLNPQFSPLAEHWVEGCEWDELMAGLEIGEGDVVRTFKRTMDVLRQLTIIPGVPEDVVRNARIALDCINRDPISEDV